MEQVRFILSMTLLSFAALSIIGLISFFLMGIIGHNSDYYKRADYVASAQFFLASCLLTLAGWISMNINITWGI